MPLGLTASRWDAAGLDDVRGEGRRHAFAFGDDQLDDRCASRGGAVAVVHVNLCSRVGLNTKGVGLITYWGSQL